MQSADPHAADADKVKAYNCPPSFRLAAQGHNFCFFPDGAERLAALLDLIGSAQRSLHIFYYLFDDDRSGEIVRDALVAAARRGVDVQLIVDAFGNDAGRAFFIPLTEAGGRFAVFSPRVRLRYLVRNHQKLAIADGTRVLTGGANVSDHYFNPPEKNGWCDLAVLIEGPVVVRFTEWFALLAGWVESEGAGRLSELRALRAMITAWDGGDGPVRLLVGGPLVRRGHWAAQLRKDLARAHRVDTVSAYFSPTCSLRRQIAQVASRGMVRMVMAGKSDIDAAIAMARHLYGKLLAANARICEFQPSKLHMKLIVVDDASYIGSANLDKRSLRINVELMVRIEDAAVAARLRELVDHLEAASVPVTREWYYREAGWLNRLRWWLAYWLAFADYRLSTLGAR